MKNLYQKLRAVGFIILIQFLCTNLLEAQKINIPDGAYFIINPNTSVIVPSDLNLGNGSTGTLDMRGALLKVSGALNINSGAEFKISDGYINASSTNYNANSTVSYEGNNQTVTNSVYGNLIFKGTGAMQISGDAVTPTSCNNLTVQNTGNILTVPENKALTVTGDVINNATKNEIIVASSALGDGSLIMSTADVNGTVKRYINEYITCILNSMALHCIAYKQC